MSRKEVLTKRLLRLKAKRDALVARSDASEDAKEVRAINEELKDINLDIDEAQAEIAAIDAEERERVPDDAVLRNAQILGAFGTPAPAGQAGGQPADDNPLNSVEYRQAFMKFIQKRTPIPAELRSRVNEFASKLTPEQCELMGFSNRAGETITTSDTSAAIPVVLMQQIINTVRTRYGNIYRKARKMSIPGGIHFAIGALDASFKWITQDTVSPTQKTAALGTISFSYYTAELKIARSYLTTLLTLTDFEAKLVEVIARAYAKMMDEAIVKGTGNGMPLGIINDPRVANDAKHVFTMSAGDMNNWQAWLKKIIGNIPLGYRDFEWIMPLGTIDKYLRTMADGQNNPLYYEATGLVVSSGDNQEPSARFYGKEMSPVEPTVIPDFDSASSGDVIAVIWQPMEYGVNEPLGFTMKRYDNDDANQIIDKAICVADGKILNPNGFYLIKKA